MKRPSRLQSAVSWLKQYGGGNVLRGYCKHFGVDWRCAATELKQLGVKLDPEYLRRRESTERQLANHRQRRRQPNADENAFCDSLEYDSPLAAYLAEDYAALYAMECERDGMDLETDREKVSGTFI